MKSKKLEKDLYDAVDTFTGSRETHTKTFVRELIKIFKKYCIKQHQQNHGK